jgi:glycosyltransferase involved in cell wall biosynthesis
MAGRHLPQLGGRGSQQMNIWIICPYGPIPGEGWRDFRYTMLGEALARRGNTVVWWTSSFSHHFKYQRAISWKDVEITPRFIVRLVPSTSYRNNRSLSRLVSEVVFAAQTYRRATRATAPPDVIVAADPPQLVSYLGVRLASLYKCTALIDVADLWPELFASILRRPLRGIVRLMCAPLSAWRRANLRRADGVTAVSESYLGLARREAANLGPTNSLTVYLGIDVSSIERSDRETSSTILPQKAPGESWVVYAGSLGVQYDIESVLRASDELGRRASRVRIVIAGAGPLEGRVRQFAAADANRNMVYLGALDPDTLGHLYRRCDAALCPYAAGSTVAMPVKVFDYLAAGLPLINSLPGELADLLVAHRVGRAYYAGDALSLVQAIETLVGDSVELSAMSTRCRRLAQQFDKNTQYSRFCDLIERLARTIPQASRPGE